MTDQLTSPNPVELAADIVSAFVSKNSVPLSELPTLIASVHAALVNLGKPAQSEPEQLVPPVSIKKSITPDFLISLEDGKRYKSLRRHLAGRGLTPDQYRAKWGLPRDYPMVSPNYSAQRSDLARRIGLGQIRKDARKQAGSGAAPSAKGSSEAPKPRRRKKPA
jgi:predicted transcriptional regulator